MCVYICTYIYIHTHTHTHTHVCVYIYIYNICICICIYIHALMCIYIYVYIHIKASEERLGGRASPLAVTREAMNLVHVRRISHGNGTSVRLP